jgi:hypothetical protein
METFKRIERALLPPPQVVCWNGGDVIVEQYSTAQKVEHCVKNFVTFIGLVMVSPLTIAYDIWSQRQVLPMPKTPDLGSPPVWPPNQRGFASSLFQTAGLGTKWSAIPDLKGRCDWDKWMDDPEHIHHPEGFDYKDFFTDVLTDPSVYIQMLKDQGVTAHRFSLEWSVIEPEPGKIDERAVELYKNFIQKLGQADITPSVTLSHFVLPEWFYESGSFQKIENVDHYVSFALKAMDLFPEGLVVVQ